MNNTLVTIFAICGIVIIEVVALLQGFNHALLFISFTLLGAIAGVPIHKFLKNLFK